MSNLVTRILSGDSCVAVTTFAVADGQRRIVRTELTAFVLRNTHFWGLSEMLMRPDPERTTLQPIVFVYSDCVAGFEPFIFPSPDETPDRESQYSLNRDGATPPPTFVMTADYEPVWSSTEGDDPARIGECIAEAR